MLIIFAAFYLSSNSAMFPLISKISQGRGDLHKLLLQALVNAKHFV